MCVFICASACMCMCVHRRASVCICGGVTSKSHLWLCTSQTYSPHSDTLCSLWSLSYDMLLIQLHYFLRRIPGHRVLMYLPVEFASLLEAQGHYSCHNDSLTWDFAQPKDGIFESLLEAQGL